MTNISYTAEAWPVVLPPIKALEDAEDVRLLAKFQVNWDATVGGISRVIRLYETHSDGLFLVVENKVPQGTGDGHTWFPWGVLRFSFYEADLAMSCAMRLAGWGPVDGVTAEDVDEALMRQNDR